MNDPQPTANDLLDPCPSRLNEAAFVSSYGDVYEHSPWIAREAHRRGLDAACDHPDGLAACMAEVLRAAPAQRQIEVLRAHPDLAGKAALRGELTAGSNEEQAGAGLDQCSPEELERFQRLNDAYRSRFGIPFIIAVRGLHRRDILEAFETRLHNDVDTERATAVEQVNRIALLRLRARAASSAARP